MRRFRQLDVFSDRAGFGNPLAVVVDGDGLTDDEMQRFANWMNLSETTFLLPPTDPAADYRVRIFTTTVELPFAGHPTLGSCHAWLATRDDGHSSSSAHGSTPLTVTQECGIGLVELRVVDGEIAFAAPALLKSGPVDPSTDLAIVIEVGDALGREPVSLEWGDNGPGWVIAELDSAESVRSLIPSFSVGSDLKLGVFGFEPDRSTIEVRAFFPGPGAMFEDPVTGSLNAAIATILMERDPALMSYIAHQGVALGRDGTVAVERDGDDIWIGGRITPVISGHVDL